MKILPTSRLTDKQHKQTLEEVQNQLTLDHPNICRLLEVYEENKRSTVCRWGFSNRGFIDLGQVQSQDQDQGQGQDHLQLQRRPAAALCGPGPDSGPGPDPGPGPNL